MARAEACEVPIHLKAALTKDEVAAMSSISYETLNRLIAAGKGPILRFPSSRAIVLRADFDAWLPTLPTGAAAL